MADDSCRIFLSHAGADGAMARRISDVLRDAGFAPWLDVDEILPGDSVPKRLGEGLSQADYVVVCLSRAAADSGWVEAERDVSTMSQFASGDARVLPVRLEDVQPPALLAHLRYVDLFPSDEQFQVGIEMLCRALAVRAHSTDPPTSHSPMFGARQPSYCSADTRALSKSLEKAYARKHALDEAGENAGEVVSEILELKRALRSGGQLKAGDCLGGGRYLLLSAIGRGGFATVWRALDTIVGDSVAIKALHPELAGDNVQRQRFFRGARMMAEIEHECVVRVLAPHGEDAGFHYYVMELMAGGSVQAAVLCGRVSREDALPVILRIGDGLADAHHRGYVHRDVKPSNVLLTASQEPKLTDFDLVAAMDTTGGTRTGAMGSFIYAAPEQLHRPQDANARADVYGLAMTLIFVLHGAELPLDVVRDSARFVRRLPCDDGLKWVLRRALHWDETQRFGDASEFCQAIRERERRVKGYGARASDSTYEIRERFVCPEIVGRSERLAQLLRTAALLAKTDNQLLITGPSGSGKTLLARAIHRNSTRSDGPFVEVNCAAIPRNLIDLELFGAEQGAHSTASVSRPGQVELADGGTLFLDEIGELERDAQAKLLMLLQSGVFFRLGARSPTKLNCRVISATVTDLETAVREDDFRADLRDRLSIFDLKVPPLSERIDDVALLVEHFCAAACAEHEWRMLEVGGETIEACERAAWPGNVRQLSNVIMAAVIRATGEQSPRLEAQHTLLNLPGDSSLDARPTTLRGAYREFERGFLQQTLQNNGWNMSATARELDIARSHLYRLVHEHDLKRLERN